MSKKILVIDDEPDTITLMVKRLSANGFEVSSSLDPIDGFQKIKSELPDLVILDVLMPRMTGYDLVQEVKKAAKDIAKTIPIIVISGRKNMKDFFNRWDIHSFHVKPFDSEVLMRSINDALKISTTESVFADLDVKAAVQAPAAAAPKPVEPVPPPKPQSAPAPAVQAPAMPPAKPGSKGRVLIVGVEDFVVDKLKAFFEKQGYQTDTTMDEAYTLRQAGAWKPDMIFCQFWEEAQTLDTRSIYKKLKADPAAKEILFTAYCPAAVAVEALKLIEPGQVITYSKTDELLTKVTTYLKARGR